MSTLAEVKLWGRRVGAVALEDGDPIATFEYEPDFAADGVELSPLVMPLRRGARYRFPNLAMESFSPTRPGCRRREPRQSEVPTGSSCQMTERYSPRRTR